MKKGLALTVVLAALALPASAGAEVYCVGLTGGDCGVEESGDPAGLAAALDAANSSSDPDTVRVGEGTYPTPSPAGFTHQGDTSGNTVSIIGAGEGLTTIEVPALDDPPLAYTQYVGLTIGGAGSSVSDLTVTLPEPADADNTNQQYRGIEVPNSGTLTRVTVQGPEVPLNAFALVATSGTITGATVSMPRAGAPTSVGIANPSDGPDDLTVTDSVISADTPVRWGSGGGGSALLDRSILRPGDGAGLDVGPGTAEISNSLVDLGGLDGAVGISAGYSNGFDHDSAVQATGVTVAGTGSGAIGVRAFADDLNINDPDPPNDPLPPDTASVTLESSVIAPGIGTSIRRRADNGGTAGVTAGHSSYDASDVDESNGASGNGQVVSTDQVAGDPGFAGAADFHPGPGSPLIDAGDPADPISEKDLDGGPRLLDGDNDCGPVRDVGAYEYVPPAPTTSFDTGPGEGTTSNANPSFGFSSSRACAPVFECSLDGAAFTSCATPLAPGPLEDAEHTLSVRALGERSEPGPAAIRTFTSDGTPPETSILAGPSGPTTDRRPSFAFSTGEPPGSFECRFDQQPFTACSGPGNTHRPGTALPDGAHNFEVRASDAVDNDDPTPASRSFSVDSTAPQTVITSGPRGKLRTRHKRVRVTFAFASDDPGATLDCSLDGGAYLACASPRSYLLGPGAHAFRVRATDPLTNRDATPAVRRVKVKRIAPARRRDD